MARIKIECFEKDKDCIFGSFTDGNTCPMQENDKCNWNCEECIKKNVEFVIKEEKE